MRAQPGRGDLHAFQLTTFDPLEEAGPPVDLALVEPVRPAEALQPGGLARLLDWQVIRLGLGLPAASLIAFIAGLMCLAAAIATGLVFTAATVLDWQAVQIWRVQWLLGAAAAFLAGILLKRN